MYSYGIVRLWRYKSHKVTELVKLMNRGKDLESFFGWSFFTVEDIEKVLCVLDKSIKTTGIERVSADHLVCAEEFEAIIYSISYV